MTPEDYAEFLEFLEFKKQRQAQQGGGVPVATGEGKSPTIRELYEGGFRSIAERNKSWKSVGRCHWLHLLPFFGDLTVDQIDFDKGDAYQAHRLAQKRLVPDGRGYGRTAMKPGKQNVKPATVNNELNSMRALLNWAVKRGKISKNPLTGHPDLDVEQKRRFHCTEEDFLQILEHCPPVARLMFILSYETGMRRDEFRLLQWSEVNLQSDPPTITLPPHRVKGKDRPGKKGRTIALSKLAVDVIKAAPRMVPSKYVFPNPREIDGSEYKKSTLYTQFVTARVRAGVKGPEDQDYWTHSLRKSYGVNNARRGMSIYDLMKQMGHVSYEVHREYTEQSPDYLKSVAAVLNQSPPRMGPRSIEEAERESNRDTPSDAALREYLRNSRR